jgi:hypothetical protein
MCCIEVVAETLGTQKDDHNEIRIDAGHENADHLAIIVTLRNTLGRGKWNSSPILDSMVALADETSLPSWYDVPTTNVRIEPGDSSIRWMGTIPHAPWTQNCSKKAAAITASVVT